MLRFVWIGLLVASSCLAGCGKKEIAVPDGQKPVVDEIKAQGGIIGIDESQMDVGVVSVNLQGTKIDDEFVRRLSAFPELRRLSLRGTKITDASISSLLKMKKLTQLDVGDTKLSEKGKAALREAFAEIQLEGAEEPPPPIEDGAPIQ
jgi:hypothetical protein